MKLIVFSGGAQITEEFLNSGPCIESPERPVLVRFRAEPSTKKQAIGLDEVLVYTIKFSSELGSGILAHFLYEHLKERFSHQPPRDVRLDGHRLGFKDPDEEKRRIANRFAEEANSQAREAKSQKEEQ